MLQTTEHTSTHYLSFVDDHVIITLSFSLAFIRIIALLAFSCLFLCVCGVKGIRFCCNLWDLLQDGLHLGIRMFCYLDHILELQL